MTLELSQAEDRERKRLAEILHDDLQQQLGGGEVPTEAFWAAGSRTTPALQAIVAQVDHMLNDAIAKSRSLSHELSPAVLHHGDFGETLALAGRAGAGEARLGGPRGRRTAESKVSSDAAQDVPLPGGPGTPVQRRQARPASRRPASGSAGCGAMCGLAVSDRGRGLRPAGSRGTPPGSGC